MTEAIRILIADDHPIVREGLARVLNQEEDLKVVGLAENGLEAVARARELRPDIILMDLQMPEMDGVEAIQKVKEEAPDIGIIILTTYDADDYLFRGIEAGARGYLLKDSPPEEVLKAIRAVHKGESLIQPKVASRLLDRFSQLARAPDPVEVLSPREVEVLQLMAKSTVNKKSPLNSLSAKARSRPTSSTSLISWESRVAPRRLPRPPEGGSSAFS